MNKNCTTKQRSGALHMTQKVDYGIILLTNLANNKTSTSIKTVAEANNLSFLFLQKIARLLQKSKIIKAERGKFGGYVLTEKPKDLTLKTIIESLEGPIAITPCLRPFGKNLCKHSKVCEIKRKFQELNLEIQEHFLSKTLNYFI